MKKMLYFCHRIVPATLPAEQRTRAGRFIYIPMEYTKQPISVADLKALLVKYPTADPAAMGFPQGWRQEPLWL